MNRKGFIQCSVAAVASLFSSRLSFASDGMSPSVSGEKFSAKEKKQLEEMTELRHKARWRTRRIIMNNDGNDIQSTPDEVITPDMFLSKRMKAIVGSQVDTYCYCTGITFGGSHRSGKDRLVQKRFGMDRCLEELDKLDTDPMQLVTDFCHQHNIEVFWSHRMNDNHDYLPERKELLSNFKLSHPEYLFGHTLKKLHPKQATCFDYAIPQVRDKMVESCKVVVDGYDVDGIELDFFRHMTFFKSTITGGEASDSEREMMNDMMRKIRLVLDKASIRRGHPILLSVRVPDSLEFSRRIGLDYDQWVKEDIVDLLVANDYVKFEPWSSMANYGKEHKIPVYASIEKRRLHLMQGFVEPEDGNDLQYWMDEAYAAWLSGMNGIHLFNIYDPYNPVLSLLGDARLLALKGAEPRESFGTDTKGYCDPNYWLKGGRNFLRIPAKIEYHKPAKRMKWPNTDTEIV